jgi:hypothetical protein
LPNSKQGGKGERIKEEDGSDEQRNYGRVQKDLERHRMVAIFLALLRMGGEGNFDEEAMDVGFSQSSVEGRQR